jgi:hypothetical protein
MVHYSFIIKMFLKYVRLSLNFIFLLRYKIHLSQSLTLLFFCFLFIPIIAKRTVISTQGLYFEPLKVVIVFFEIESCKPFSQAGFELWSS